MAACDRARPDPIERRCRDVLARVPEHVEVLAAVKGREPSEVHAAVRAGIVHLGGNYVQEVEAIRSSVSEVVQWHMIGKLQKNKARKALQMFDWVQTVDSAGLAERLDRVVGGGSSVPVLVQVNIGREPQKAGVLPEDLAALVRHLATLPGIVVRGLMTLPPMPQNPEDSRPHFRRMRQLFGELQAEDIPGVQLDVLSMGMSDDWPVAVDEGATMIRLGTVLFGPRS